VFSQLEALNVTLARVNVIEEKSLYESQYLAETPTCKLYRKGQSEMYAGEYSIDSMAWWIQEKMNGSKHIIYLQDYEHLQKLKSLHEVVIIGNFANNTTKELETFSAMPPLFLDGHLVFAAIFNNSILTKNGNISELWLNETTTSSIMILNQKSNFSVTSYPGSKNITVVALKRWIKKNSIQAVKWIVFSEAKAFLEKKPVVILFMNPPLPYQYKPNTIIQPMPIMALGGLNSSHQIPPQRIEALHSFYSVAHDYKNKLNFGLMDARRSEYFKDALGAKDPSEIAFVFLDLAKKCNKVFSGKINEEKLARFIDEQLNGECTEVAELDSIPEIEVKSTQQKLSPEEFASLYKTADEPAIVLVTLRWCAYCKRIWPLYWSLANDERLTRVNFRYFDLSQDELPSSLRSIEMFPTLVALMPNRDPEILQISYDEAELTSLLYKTFDIKS
jgi:thiol-disulfide isomerase/thioredoxin